MDTARSYKAYSCRKTGSKLMLDVEVPVHGIAVRRMLVQVGAYCMSRIEGNIRQRSRGKGASRQISPGNRQSEWIIRSYSLRQCPWEREHIVNAKTDRKSTRLNSSHVEI